MEKTNKVKKILEKNNTFFIVRAVLFGLLLIAPAVYLFIKYRCYEFTSKLSLGGWGILALIIFAVGVYTFLKYLIFGGVWAYWKQVIQGILKVVLPLTILIVMVAISLSFREQLLWFLGVALGCWFSAYLINPFPEWTYKKTLGETADVVDFAISRIHSEKVEK